MISAAPAESSRSRTSLRRGVGRAIRVILHFLRWDTGYGGPNLHHAPCRPVRHRLPCGVVHCLSLGLVGAIVRSLGEPRTARPRSPVDVVGSPRLGALRGGLGCPGRDSGDRAGRNAATLSLVIIAGGQERLEQRRRAADGRAVRPYRRPSPPWPTVFRAATRIARAGGFVREYGVGSECGESRLVTRAPC